MTRAVAAFAAIALLPFWLYCAAFMGSALLREPSAKMQAEGTSLDWFLWGLAYLAPYFAAWFAAICALFAVRRWFRQRLKT